MSANEISLASPSRSAGPPTNVQACARSRDNEMTCLLISTEDDSARSRSSSPLKEMSYQPSRDRAERQGSARPSASTSGRSSSSVTPGPVSNYWRREEIPGFAGPSYQGSSGYFSGPYDPNSPMLAESYGSPPLRPRDNSVMTGENSVPLSTVVPGHAFPTETQLNLAYAYGIQREDGSYTRLIRADSLAERQNLPLGQGPEGLIILPSPRQIDPAYRQGPETMISNQVVQQLPGNRRRGHAPIVRPDPNDATQLHIDTIIAQAASVPAPAPHPPRRREKVYCDKWIHEGVCAFTQMGCKYKHEMPMDKETQSSLGLNHGLPNWYRRAYAINVQPTSPPALPGPPPATQRRLEGPWRSLELAQATEDYTPPDSSMHSGTPNPRQSYGPIAPPAAQTPFSNNSYAPLKIEEQDDEEEEDEVTWRGRGGPQQH